MRMLNSVGKTLRDLPYELPAPPFLRSLADVTFRVVRNFARNDGAHMAAGMAYYAIFSLFPLALGAMAIATFLVSPEEAQATLFDFFETQLPGLANTDVVRDNIEGIVASRGALGAFSIASLIFAGRSVFGAMHRIMDRAWQVSESRHFVVEQVRQIAMAAGVGLALLASVGLSSSGHLLAQGASLLGFRGQFVEWAWAGLFAILPYVLSTFGFALVYRFVPHAPVRWRDVIPAAVLAGLLFELAKLGFVLYLTRFANFDRVYGSISTLVVLLLWVYIACFVLVVGAEVASETGRSRQGRLLRFRGNLRPIRGGLRPLRNALPEE